MTLQCADDILEENSKKIRQNGAAAAFVDARFAADHVDFPLADLVKEGEADSEKVIEFPRMKHLDQVTVKVLRWEEKDKRFII